MKPFYSAKEDAAVADTFIELGQSPGSVGLILSSSATEFVVKAPGQLVEVDSLNNQFIISPSGNIQARCFTETGIGSGKYAAVVSDWSSRVVANGGAIPSTTTLNALNTFYNGLVAAELDIQMAAVNCFVPDSLIACITPLIVGSGSNPWTSSGFVAGDLNVDGLWSSGSLTKFLNTGVLPNLAYGGSRNFGMTIYTTSNGVLLYTPDVGAVNGNYTQQNSRLFAPYRLSGPPQAQFTAFGGGEGGSGYVNSSLLPTGSKGYYSGNRIGTNNLVIYLANSTTPHVQAASTVLNYGSVPTVSYTVFRVNSQASGFTYSDRRLSFVALHRGLSLAQSNTLYNLVQAMRMSLGGGYV